MPKDILLTHARKYPLMQPRDAVKLLYQSEFGGGHLIRDEKTCLAFLQQEYDATAQSNTPLLEEIGSGMVRVQLSALDAYGYAPQQLGQDFIRSAAAACGSMTGLQQKLQLLEELTAMGQMPFSVRELACYLDEYRQAGYPAVSHSETYRSAYHPAYRVMRACYLPERIKDLLQNSKIVR